MVVGAATIASALATELMGLHYIIGAFLVGAIIPAKLHQPILDRLQVMTVALLMPFFFTLTGMRILIDPSSPALLEVFAITTAVAAFGIVGGTAAAARLTGEPWSVAFSLGSLLQSKGLTELVVLTILLDARIISPTIFTAMILMALVSTALTMPLARFDSRENGRAVCRRRGRRLARSASIDPTLGGRSSFRLCKRGLGHRPPSSYRPGILDRQFGFDHLDPIKSIGAHGHIERLAKLLLFGRGQFLVEQAQVWAEDVVGWLRIGSRRAPEHASQHGRFLELHKQAFRIVPRIGHAIRDQLYPRELPGDQVDDAARLQLARAATKYGHVRLEFDRVEARGQTTHNPTKRRAKRLAGRQPQGELRV